MKPFIKSTHWKSLITGNTFCVKKYVNHGYGGLHHGFMDLPKEEYPYTLLFEKNTYPIPYIPNLKVIDVVECEIYGAILNLNLNGIKLNGTWEECLNQLEEYRKTEEGIGIRLIK